MSILVFLSTFVVIQITFMYFYFRCLFSNFSSRYVFKNKNDYLIIFIELCELLLNDFLTIYHQLNNQF